MRPTTRRRRNSRGEFSTEVGDQVATVENQVAANAEEQKQIMRQVAGGPDFGALVTLKRWKIAITPDRAELCLWLFIMVVKFLSMLSIISFWLSLTMFLKTLPSWQGPVRLFDGYRRRNQGGQNVVVNPDDNWWTDLFPRDQVLNSYTLWFGFYQTGDPDAVLLHDYTVPLVFRNCVVWIFLMAFFFCSYHFLSFIQGCLQQAKLAAKVFARRRSS